MNERRRLEIKLYLEKAINGVLQKENEQLRGLLKEREIDDMIKEKNYIGAYNAILLDEQMSQETTNLLLSRFDARVRKLLSLQKPPWEREMLLFVQPKLEKMLEEIAEKEAELIGEVEL